MSPLSLAWRVRLLVTAVVAVVVAVVGATAYERFRGAWLDHVDRLLAIMVEGAAVAAGTAHDPERLRSDLERITDSPWRGPRTEFLVWIDGDGEGDERLASPAAARLFRELPDPGPQPGAPAFFDLRQANKNYRAVWLREPVRADLRNVLIAHPTGFEQRRLRELLGALLLSGSLAVLLAATAGTHVVLWALRPLRAMTARIARIREDDPDARGLKQVPVPPELRPVADEVANLVDRLGTALEQQKRLIADAAHQLRTPLALARSTLELGRAAGAGPDAPLAAIRDALGDLDRLESLTGRLLTLARLEQGAATSEGVNLRLDVLLEELAVSWDRTAAEQGGHVVHDGSSPCHVRGDEQQLELLFGSLIENALIHGPEAGTVRVRVRGSADGCCIAEVEDQGGSIPADMLGRVFDRFYRAEDARRRHPGGTGLGLAIVREIALRHGGEVWVTTTPGSRTIFHVRLPAANPPS